MTWPDVIGCDQVANGDGDVTFRIRTGEDFEKRLAAEAAKIPAGVLTQTFMALGSMLRWVAHNIGSRKDQAVTTTAKVVIATVFALKVEAFLDYC